MCYARAWCAIRGAAYIPLWGEVHGSPLQKFSFDPSETEPMPDPVDGYPPGGGAVESKTDRRLQAGRTGETGRSIASRSARGAKKIKCLDFESKAGAGAGCGGLGAGPMHRIRLHP